MEKRYRNLVASRSARGRARAPVRRSPKQCRNLVAAQTTTPALCSHGLQRLHEGATANVAKGYVALPATAQSRSADTRTNDCLRRRPVAQ